MPLQIPYVPVLDKAYCTSLQKGSYIVGGLGIVFNIAKFILLIYVILNLRHHSISGEEQEHAVKTTGHNASIITEIIAALEWMCKGNIKFCIVAIVIAGILWLLDSTLNVVLVYALFKGKPKLMEPYLMWSLFAIASNLLNSVTGGVYVTVVNIPYGLTVIVITILATVLFLYMWIVLYSYYWKLQGKKNVNVEYEPFANTKRILL